MTDTATADRPETQTAPDPLYVNDAQLIRRLGIPEKKARHLLRYFDNNPKLLFPQKDKLCDGRRYWPAGRVQATGATTLARRRPH
jgi:hypothetical protein